MHIEVLVDVEIDPAQEGEDIGAGMTTSGLWRTSPVARFIAANRSTVPLRL